MYSAASSGLVMPGGGSYGLPDVSNSQQSGIWVSGEGSATVVPDLAGINLGIEAQASTVAEAREEAAQAMTEVMAALEDNGIASRDIKTQWFNISPQWRDGFIVGYRVTNMVMAKVRDMDEVGSVIDDVAEAGGDLTRIQGVSFTVDDPSVYYAQAREEAMLNAIAKAEQLAALAGVTLGPPTYIAEGGGYASYDYYDYGMRAMAEEAAAPTPISAGETEISLTVQVGFAIVP